MKDKQPQGHCYRIVAFQQQGSGENKMQGILAHGKAIELTKVFNIDGPLPELVDNPQDYISNDFSADLVLSFLKHPDLAEFLVTVCRDKKIPVIAAGKKIPGAITPFTCCGLGRQHDLGAYGARFGLPEIEIELENGRISKARVLRGASCGATWQAISKIIGLTPDKGIVTFAREVQYLCQADPSAFDPISGKSSLHYAGDVHSAALKKALPR